MSMKKSLLGVIGVLGGLAIVGFASAPAQAQTVDPAKLTVLKQVSGTFPEGTVFTVQVTCNLDGTEGDVDTDVTFDATGTPTSNNVFLLTDYDGQCYVQETGTGGAAVVAYQCVDNGDDLLPGADELACEELQEGKFSVDFDNAAKAGAIATVTVQNTAPLADSGSDPGRLLVIGAGCAAFGLVLAGAFGRRRPANG